jgi:hypothetical protein
LARTILAKFNLIDVVAHGAGMLVLVPDLFEFDPANLALY